MTFNSVPELVEDLRAGRMIILVDDEDRENEGDLIVASSCITPEHINFMARYGRGLICLTLTEQRCAQLKLPLMVSTNTEAQGTRFTVSVDAARGITTGISASDRAAAVHAAVQPDAVPEDLVQPGHIFPLMAEPGGVLTRAGHTEAGCDLARLAGFEASATIVEVLNEDGTMARRADLEHFATEHQLKMGTIADLIEYRMVNETTVRRAGECLMPTVHGEFRTIAFRSTVSDELHLALIKGEIEGDDPITVRVHVRSALTDLTGGLRPDFGRTVAEALDAVNRIGRGIVVILRYPESNAEIERQIRRLQSADAGEAVPDYEPPEDLRTHGVGAQILVDLGVRQMRVLGSPVRLHAFSGFGLEITEYVTD
ncbi:MAG: 3,4-dihydroxy-2-butanone-4-phosphate synthase [Pseudomonadota bacterium]